MSLLSNEEWIEIVERNDFKIVDKFYDGLWDSPYFPGVPAFIQHLVFKIPFTLLFPLGLKLPAKLGENPVIVGMQVTGKGI